MLIETEIVNCSFCQSDQTKHVTFSKDYNYQTCDNEFEFVECSNCGQVYLKNRPTIDNLKVIYPDSYVAYKDNEEEKESFLDKIKNFFIKQKINPIKRYCSDNSDLKIMEGGCADGKLVKLLKKFGDPSWDIYGLDISDHHFAKLNELGIKTIQSRFEELEGYDNFFDVIVMNQVIEHLDNPLVVVKQAKKMLKEGGVLILETPSLDGWDKKLFGTDGIWEGWHTPRHWHLFDEQKLSTITENAGLKTIDIEYILSPYLWTYSIRNWVKHNQKFTFLEKFLNLDNFFLLASLGVVDKLQLFITGKTSNFRLVSQKA